MALTSGVPMITCQTSEDKQTIGTIMEDAGVTIYHRIEELTPEIVKTSFDELEKNPKYKQAALRLAREYQKYDTLEIVHNAILKGLRGEVKEAQANGHKQ